MDEYNWRHTPKTQNDRLRISKEAKQVGKWLCFWQGQLSCPTRMQHEEESALHGLLEARRLLPEEALPGWEVGALHAQSPLFNFTEMNTSELRTLNISPNGGGHRSRKWHSVLFGNPMDRLSCRRRHDNDRIGESCITV